ncbi:MAG: TetR/AcrR family transcriptional regulator [Alphaproteobacteria bacterium]|nr:MAG: TetR/AcrR family transcriptional regulator [Alphaproteobacteria bacterium]
MAEGEQGKAVKRRRLPSEERRREFVTKAIEFFAEEGFESSTRELARRLGVTQPLLYRYFPSKDDLIAEVYETVYVRRWRPEWEAMLADRSVPLRARLIGFYEDYTRVVFQLDWMRIFLAAGLKGVDINPRYIARVQSRILEPIVREWRHDRGLADLAPTPEEVECAWVMHGAIYYYGVRRRIYQRKPLDRLDFTIRCAIDGFLNEIAALHG